MWASRVLHSASAAILACLIVKVARTLASGNSCHCRVQSLDVCYNIGRRNVPDLFRDGHQSPNYLSLTCLRPRDTLAACCLTPAQQQSSCCLLCFRGLPGASHAVAGVPTRPHKRTGPAELFGASWAQGSRTGPRAHASRSDLTLQARHQSCRCQGQWTLRPDELGFWLHRWRAPSRATPVSSKQSRRGADSAVCKNLRGAYRTTSLSNRLPQLAANSAVKTDDPAHRSLSGGRPARSRATSKVCCLSCTIQRPQASKGISDSQSPQSGSRGSELRT